MRQKWSKMMSKLPYLERAADDPERRAARDEGPVDAVGHEGQHGVGRAGVPREHRRCEGRGLGVGYHHRLGAWTGT